MEGLHTSAGSGHQQWVWIIAGGVRRSLGLFPWLSKPAKAGPIRGLKNLNPSGRRAKHSSAFETALCPRPLRLLGFRGTIIRWRLGALSRNQPFIRRGG